MIRLILGAALALGALSSAPRSLADDAKPAALLVRGKIKAMARPPKPRTAPYKDAVISIDLSDVQVLEGQAEPKEILVFAWGMRDNVWTPEASYRVGQTIQLRLRPWDEVAEKYGSYNRIELEGDEIFQLEPFWADSIKPAPR